MKKKLISNTYHGEDPIEAQPKSEVTVLYEIRLYQDDGSGSIESHSLGQYTGLSTALEAFEQAKQVAADEFESEYLSTRGQVGGPSLDDQVIELTQYTVNLKEASYIQWPNTTDEIYVTLDEYAYPNIVHEYRYSIDDFVKDQYMKELKPCIPDLSYTNEEWLLPGKVQEYGPYGMPEFIKDAITETAANITERNERLAQSAKEIEALKKQMAPSAAEVKASIQAARANKNQQMSQQQTRNRARHILFSVSYAHIVQIWGFN